MSNECIFCKIASGAIPAEKLHEDEDILAFKDINPAAPVHVLIIPKKHIPTLNDIEADTSVLVGKMMLAARSIAKKLQVSENGYRVVVNCNREAGQEIFHLHAHLLGGRPMGKMG